MPARTSTENKFEEIVKNLIAPLFKAKGFNKKRYNFYKAFDTFGWHFNIQKSVYDSKNHISFTFNCSVFIPEIYQKYYTVPRQIPEFPVEYECHIRKRIGGLINNHDYWYDLDQNTILDQLKNNINKHLTEYVFPFFENLNNMENIINYMLKDEGRNFLLFYLLFKYRDSLSASAFLKKEYVEANNEHYKKRLEKIAQEYNIALG